MQVQIGYITSHLQIADAKAAGALAYATVVSGYTASKLDLLADPHFTLGMALGAAGIFCGLFAVFFAFFAISPRTWTGSNSEDVFSWVGLTASANRISYPVKATSIAYTEAIDAMADTIETCAQVIARKYAHVKMSVFATLVSTLFQFSSWIFL